VGSQHTENACSTVSKNIPESAEVYVSHVYPLKTMEKTEFLTNLHYGCEDPKKDHDLNLTASLNL